MKNWPVGMLGMFWMHFLNGVKRDAEIHYEYAQQKSVVCILDQMKQRE